MFDMNRVPMLTFKLLSQRNEMFYHSQLISILFNNNLFGPHAFIYTIVFCVRMMMIIV